MKKWLICLLGCLFLVNARAQNITGVWKTIDEKSGEARSLVKIYENQGKFYGKIIKLFHANPQYDPTCTKCPGALKDKKVMGLQVINGLTLKGKIWEGEDGILDPDSGKLYDVKIWMEGEKLKVRGYLGFLYRTQTWLRVKPI